jgi:hypothetical protein
MIRRREVKFYIILGVSFVLTLLCGAFAVFLALQINSLSSPETKAVASNAALMFAFGMGNIVGLLAGHRWN